MSSSDLCFGGRVIFFLTFICTLNACGPITHIEISFRSLYSYSDVHGSFSYDRLLRQNQGALEAGNAYPDAFYPSVCFGGKYHDVSETTHWTPFTNATIQYIRNNYPQPWNKTALKLVSFLMGVVSHQVADVSWHSIAGMKQGFLSTMADVNYHGVYPVAHHDGDLGGDVLNLYQLDLSYSKIFGEWYIPVYDLINIYKELYGNNTVNRELIEVCTKILYLEKIGERLAVKKYFPLTAKNSPFLVNQLYGYFFGGVRDMASWTQRIWKQVSWALEHGTSKCSMNHNPLLIRCNKTHLKLLGDNINSSSTNGYYREPEASVMALMKDVHVIKQGSGVVFKPTENLKRKFWKLASAEAGKIRKQKTKNKLVTHMNVNENLQSKPRMMKPNAFFTTNVDYASLGSAFAVSDLDGDGNEDVLIGAPGFYNKSSQQKGLVFILYGSDEGLNTSVSDIYSVADVRIENPSDVSYSTDTQFGSSLTILDFDKDGNLDIIVGAPSFGSADLTYKGRVYMFSLVTKYTYSLRGTVVCQTVFCNLGTLLAAADTNSDTYSDLLLGSHYSPGPHSGPQRGMMAAVYADGNYKGKSGIWIDVADSPLTDFGRQNYSWFGYSIDAFKSHIENFTYMAIGEPNFRNCSRSNCSYDSHDMESVGKVSLLASAGPGLLTPLREFYGSKKFSMLGSALSMGRPFGGTTDVLAIAAPSEDVHGSVFHLPVELLQVGSVYLYNLSDPHLPTTVFHGDRLFGRFGDQVKFADLDRDGLDELIITAPLRTEDFTEEVSSQDQQGQVYIYKGGPNFPRGDATANCGPFSTIQPCPGEKASHVLTFGENLAQFGSQMAVVKARNKISLLVTAAHSSKQARLGGAIGVFDFH